MNIDDFIAKLTEAIWIGKTYQESWMQLYNAFGERMQNEEMGLMDAILQGVKSDIEERQNALQDKTPSKV